MTLERVIPERFSRVKWLSRKSDPGMTLRSYVDGSLDPAPCFHYFRALRHVRSSRSQRGRDRCEIQ